jgi:hypothetical protein
MEKAMTNYDPRRPPRPGDTGFRAGWIVVFVILLIIIGFGWRGGWYGHGGHVANAPTNSTANSTNGAPAPAHNKP